MPRRTETDAQIREVKQDSLGMSGRIKGITEFVTNCRTPMTIAIQGDWGTGKTSAMEMIRSELNSRDSEVCNIWFNTWQYSLLGGGELITDLMSEVCDAITQKSQSKELATFIEDKDIFKNNKKFINAITNMLNIGRYTGLEAARAFSVPTAAGAEVLNGVIELFSGGKEESPTRTQYIKDLKERMEKSISSLAKAYARRDEKRFGKDSPPHNHIFVYIDDLDRLEPRMAVELMEGLKNFMECTGCVFILAVDQEVVEKGLKSKYREDLGSDKARQFFDKLIQVPFKLPVELYEIRDYVADIAGISADDPVLDSYIKLLSGFGERNPRTIKRSFNLLSLHEYIDIAENRFVPTDRAEYEQERFLKYAVRLLRLKSDDDYSKLLNTVVMHSEPEKLCTKLNQYISQGSVKYLANVLEAFGVNTDAGSTSGESLEKLKKLSEIVMELTPWQPWMDNLPTAHLISKLYEAIQSTAVYTAAVSIDGRTVEHLYESDIARAESKVEILFMNGSEKAVTIKSKGGNTFPTLSVYNSFVPAESAALDEKISGHFRKIGNSENVCWEELDFIEDQFAYIFMGIGKRITVHQIDPALDPEPIIDMLRNCGVID